jgi:hypothetical protein
MKKTTIFITILVAMAIYSNAFSFVDVPQGHWAYESVNKLYESGMVKGKQFSGDEYASRYYFATVVARMFENIQSGKIKIQDVSYEDFERINRLAIEFANEVLPTPGGPTKHNTVLLFFSVGIFLSSKSCFTAKYSIILSFGSFKA